MYFILQKFGEKNLKSMGWPYFFIICLAKEMQYFSFYAHVHVCSPSYADEKLKTLQSIPKLCVVDHSFDRATKTLFCL